MDSISTVFYHKKSVTAAGNRLVPVYVYIRTYTTLCTVLTYSRKKKKCTESLQEKTCHRSTWQPPYNTTVFPLQTATAQVKQRSVKVICYHYCLSSHREEQKPKDWNGLFPSVELEIAICFSFHIPTHHSYNCWN